MTDSTYGDEDDDTFDEQRARVDRPMVRLFREYGREHWVAIVGGILMGIAAHTMALLPTYVLAETIDAVFMQTKPQYSLPLVPQWLVPASRTGQFWFSVGLVGLTYLSSTVFTWLMGLGLNSFAQSVQHNVRADSYDAMQRLDYEFFADKQTGELMSVLNNDVNRLEQFLNGGLFIATMLLVNVGVTAVLLAYLQWQLALLTMVTVPVIGLFTYKFVQTIQPMYSEVRSTVGQLNSRLENNLGGIEVIKASTTEDFEADRVTDASQEYYDKNWNAITTRVKFFPGLRFTAGIGFVLTFAVGGHWVLTGQAPPLMSGTLRVGTFVAFVYLGQRFIWPMSQFGELVNLYQNARASAERIFGLMDEPSTLGGGEDLPELTVEDGTVAYDHVTFGYDDDETVLEDVSFDVSGGEMLALVGPTGAGKSTVLKLLLRLYDVNDGSISIDGQDIRDVSPESLRDSVGYVSQDTYLFYGSVRDNIAYGKFDATDEEIEAAARAADAHEFISDFEDGYDTEVGERGVKLSGGQRQRIGIARVLLRDPDILLLDEATSDVDTETELRIQESIENLVADRTVIAIAHRLSTVKDADQILVLEDGAVEERGTHEELLETDGTYADLWGVQAGELETIPGMA
ncbi:ABC transporter ATP-binding protein [Haloarchaeobius sp. HME9146]|uniref:ABC transporter ATP-binding protein n=1 Tax=Haloarchaeobius sp. HME9146 TaxID=2978732 RepID=UPI0021C0C917|nr:ABC transporter ATP-binding protein [Haloarchaeobius sp. HME9146]MCT9096647.1 ABC transporter ATP-binding protein/permease [Haloarchaeobius sp. HME9146]